MRLVRGSLLAIAASAVACSYPDIAFTSDAAATDAAPDAFDATVVDTARESEPDTFVETTTDVLDAEGGGAETAQDAAEASVPDAKPDADAEAAVDGASPGCTGSTALHCADFDKVATPSSGWTYDYVTDGGTLALEKSGLSPPNALLAMAPAGGTLTTATLGKKLTAPTLDSIARIDLWLRLETATFPGDQTFLFKYERIGDGVTFSLGKSGLFVETISAKYATWPLPYVVPIGKWFHVRMDVKLRLAGGSIKVFIDDMTTPILDQSGISTLGADALDRIFIIGLWADNATGTFRARYDDVKFEFLP